MVKLDASVDRFRVFQLKSLLDAHGIPCLIKNEFAIGGAGELAPMDCLPELWLTDEEWLPRAKRLVQEFDDNDGLDWVCGHCHEPNAGSFELCWHCGKLPA